MNENNFTDKDLVRAIDLCYFTKGENVCQKCPLQGMCKGDIEILKKLTRSLIIAQSEQIVKLTEERKKASPFSMNIFELQACQDYAANEAVNNFKTALLKKIFPYDTADKKQYSINAYAVERAIIEVAEELYDTKRNN